VHALQNTYVYIKRNFLRVGLFKTARYCLESHSSSTFLIPELLVVFIGKRFGLMQVKVGLSHILSCFEDEYRSSNK
jgi:hypothetical protein